MIIYSNGKVIATDPEGNTQDIGVVGAEQDELKVSDHNQSNILNKILKQIKITNLH